MRFLLLSELDMASCLRNLAIFSLRVRRRRISGRREGADIRLDSNPRPSKLRLYEKADYKERLQSFKLSELANATLHP